MLKDFDPRQGLIKIFWQDIRDTVIQVEPTFAKLIDDLSPDGSFPLFLAFYPYGACDADDISSLFPDGNSKYYRLSDADAPKDVVKNLAYSIHQTAFSLILDKQIETYIDIKEEELTFPWTIYKAGEFMPLWHIVGKISPEINSFHSNKILFSAAGSRSSFVLPNIGNYNSYQNLCREYNISHNKIKSAYDHFHIFKSIADHEINNMNWFCPLLYFSENWMNKIDQDPAWIFVKQYLHQLAWKRFGFQSNKMLHDIYFSLLQKKKNLKPNPYLVDIAKHLISIATGQALGFSPCINEDALPLKLIQKVFVEIYKLKKYLPTIMVPAYLNKLPVYYSLQNISTYTNAPQSRATSSLLYEIRELQRIIKTFTEDLKDKKSLFSDTFSHQAIQNRQFDFYHHKGSDSELIKPSTAIFSEDPRFQQIDENLKLKDAVVAYDAPFLRACMRISDIDKPNT